jgi:hypothetical protein
MKIDRRSGLGQISFANRDSVSGDRSSRPYGVRLTTR